MVCAVPLKSGKVYGLPYLASHCCDMLALQGHNGKPYLFDVIAYGFSILADGGSSAEVALICGRFDSMLVRKAERDTYLNPARGTLENGIKCSSFAVAHCLVF
jgi:hypothetical protein